MLIPRDLIPGRRRALWLTVRKGLILRQPSRIIAEDLTKGRWRPFCCLHLHLAMTPWLKRLLSMSLLGSSRRTTTSLYSMMTRLWKTSRSWWYKTKTDSTQTSLIFSGTKAATISAESNHRLSSTSELTLATTGRSLDSNWESMLGATPTWKNKSSKYNFKKYFETAKSQTLNLAKKLTIQLSLLDSYIMLNQILRCSVSSTKGINKMALKMSGPALTMWCPWIRGEERPKLGQWAVSGNRCKTFKKNQHKASNMRKIKFITQKPQSYKTEASCRAIPTELSSSN